jgi:hypothetical protein
MNTKFDLPELEYIDLDDPRIEVIAGKFSDETITRIKRGSLRIQIVSDWYREYDTHLLLTDRRMRDLIEELRTGDVMGSRICSTCGNHGGYFVAENKYELFKFSLNDRRQALTIWNRTRAQKVNAVKAFAVNNFEELQQVSLFPDNVDA